MRKQVSLILAPLLVAVGGCFSAPVPQELVDVGPPAPPEPMLIREVVTLSRAGISEGLIAELLNSRGIADRPELPGIAALGRKGVGEPVVQALLAAPAGRMQRRASPRRVVREWFIPLWPSYSRGRWHLGLRGICYYRSEELPEGAEIVPPDPRPQDVPPAFVEL